MPYIYRYINQDGDIKYVGIIKSDTNMPNRFYQHKNDPWYSSCHNWKIEYAYYESQTDVEAIEGHLIAEYTERGENLYNISKSKWGKSIFINGDDIDWVEFSDDIVPDKTSPAQRSKYLWKRLGIITDEIYRAKFDFRKRIEDLENSIYTVREQIEKEEKSDFVNWFHENVVVIPIEFIVRACDNLDCKINATVHHFYEDYITWINSNDIAFYYDRDDFEDRIDANNGVFDTRGVYKKNGIIHGALLRSDPSCEEIEKYWMRYESELVNARFEKLLKVVRENGNSEGKTLARRRSGAKGV